MSIHGVWAKSGIVRLKGGQWDVTRLAAPESLWQICEQALAHGFTHLWVMADTGVVPDKAFFEPALEQWSLLATWRYPERMVLQENRVNELVSTTGWRLAPKGGQKQETIIFPANTRWPFGKESHPGRLLLTIEYLEKALQIPIGGSPATVGMKLIEQLNAGHPEWLAIPDVDLAACHFGREAARDLIWQRPLHHDEKKKKYLHKFDKNSAYLRACASEMFGAGTPVHVDAEAFDKKAPGVWRIAVRENKMAEDLPTVLWDGAKWVATPVVKLLIDTGHEIKIREGWKFPAYHGTLKTWAELLWGKRQEFKTNGEGLWRNAECRDHAERGIKRIATATVGLMSYGHFGEDEKTFKQRVDWKMQAVAGTYATLFYNLLKIWREHHITPVMAYMDAFYFLSDEADPSRAVPGLLEKEHALGGFKHEWTLPVDDPVLEILLMDEVLSRKLELLNKVKEGQA